MLNYVFICLSEIWLSDSFFDDELGLSNFHVFRCDRNSYTSDFYRGSGALIAIRNDVVCELLPTTINNVEHLYVTFHIQYVTFVLLVSCFVYIPPSSPVQSTSYVCQLSRLLSLSILVVYS